MRIQVFDAGRCDRCGSGFWLVRRSGCWDLSGCNAVVARRHVAWKALDDLEPVDQDRSFAAVGRLVHAAAGHAEVQVLRIGGGRR